MGSALRLPVVTGASRADIAARCRDHKIKTIASRASLGPTQGVIEDAARAERVKLCADVDMTVPIALIVGREATGIPASAEGEADEFVHIPMAKGVESLNVAAAAAILLYEAARHEAERGQTGLPDHKPPSRFTQCESRITHHVSRFHVSRITLPCFSTTAT